jgi:osmoprotectant transport system permease protein
MWEGLIQHAGRHALLTLAALSVALLAGATLGAVAANVRWARGPLLGVAALGRTVPSIAILMLVVPLLGVGVVPAVLALVLLALPPILVNVDLALRSVSTATLDAAAGLGMSGSQRFWQVSVPLALPVALSGVRVATVEVIGSATLATFIGAGGLGDDIVRALQTNDPGLLFASTVTVAGLAFAAEFIFSRLVARFEVQ